MKTRILVLLVLPVVAFLHGSCNKKQWKETVNTSISVSLNDTSIYFGVNELSIDTVRLNIESVSLIGERLQAENINLAATLNSETTFTGLNPVSLTNFAIPQGTYEPLQAAVKFGGNAGTISLRGVYTNAGGITKNVSINLNYNELVLKNVAYNNSNSVTINKNSPGKIHITLDVDVLFDNINPSMWNAANTSVVAGQNTILVSNTNNSNIYNDILSKAGASLTYNFE